MGSIADQHYREICCYYLPAFNFDLQILTIRPKNGDHPTYNKCTSDLQKVYIRPTQSVHPIYKKCTSDLQKVLIRPTNSVHPTYKKCTPDLQKVYIQPTKMRLSIFKVNERISNSIKKFYLRTM